MIWNAVISAVGGFLKDRARLKQAKLDGEVKLLQTAADNVADWEKLHAKGSMTSWKDEYVLILWTIPVILSFLPGMHVYAQQGFELMKTLPEWYTYTLVTISLASFGIRMGTTVKGMLGK